MNRRKALPDPLSGRVFTTREAREAGVSAGRLRAGDLDRTWWGVRAGAPLSTLAEVCRALAARLGARAIFSHSTAARLWGAPLPQRIPECPIHVSYLAGSRAPDADGVIGHQVRLEEVDVTVLDGLPVTAPARTWTDLPGELRFAELVGVGDHLIHHRAPLADLSALAETVRRRPTRRHVAALRRALPLLSERAESLPESLVRIALVTSGLPEVLVNVDLRDAAGRFVARPDLRFEGWPLVVEYEGDHHRTDAAQWRMDMTRVGRIEELGYAVIRLGAHDLARLDEVVARVRSRLIGLGWTP